VKDKSKKPEEQLYLRIFLIVSYLRSQPEILIIMDWLRTRRPNLGRGKAPLRIFHLFDGIDIPALKDRSAEDGIPIAINWILFLIVNTLMNRPEGMDFADLPNESIQRMYKFIALGLQGFQLS
jgi:hypothetical protein